jgi:hypothetical protein
MTRGIVRLFRSFSGLLGFPLLISLLANVKKRTKSEHQTDSRQPIDLYSPCHFSHDIYIAHMLVFGTMSQETANRKTNEEENCVKKSVQK